MIVVFIFKCVNVDNMQKKSHTCEEGGDTPQNFCLEFVDELEKQRFICCWSGSIKNKIFLVFTMLH